MYVIIIIIQFVIPIYADKFVYLFIYHQFVLMFSLWLVSKVNWLTANMFSL